ncbi:MAG: tetratricopeptide repeat protein [Pyrinomonadaceae bacterium]|nr:tetratricopeptide repeat protein [Pyrinomonadaceae bacterium]
MAEELLNALAKIDDLKVAARTSAFSFKGKNPNVSEIGRVLNVNSVLEGSVRKSGNRLRIMVQLVNAADGYHLWSERYDREMRDIFDVQDEITLSVVDALKLKLFGKKKAAVLKRGTDNTEAYQLYLKGRFHWNKRTKESLKSAVEYFNQAIAVSPGYALAYAGLADCYVLFTNYGVAPPGESYPKARAAAQKALEIDATLGEALNTLATVKQDYDWDFEGAKRDYQKAISLNPNYPTTHQWYGEFLAQMGCKDESVAELRNALELDPLSLIISKVLGGTLLFARRYDEAIAQTKKVLEMDENFAPAHSDLGWCFTKQGIYDEAIAEFQKGVTLTNGSPSQLEGLAYAFVQTGKRSEAQKILEQLKQRQRSEYVDSGFFAIIHAGLGEKDKAFTSLEKSYQEHSAGMVFLKADPRFDDLRDDPRFQELLRRVGFTP